MTARLYLIVLGRRVLICDCGDRGHVLGMHKGSVALRCSQKHSLTLAESQLRPLYRSQGSAEAVVHDAAVDTDTYTQRKKMVSHFH